MTQRPRGLTLRKLVLLDALKMLCRWSECPQFSDGRVEGNSASRQLCRYRGNTKGVNHEGRGCLKYGSDSAMPPLGWRRSPRQVPRFVALTVVNVRRLSPNGDVGSSDPMARRRPGSLAL